MAPKWTASNSGAGIVLGGAFWDGTNIYLGTNDGLLVSSNGGTSFVPAAVGGLPSGQVIISFAGAKQGSSTRFVAVTRKTADTYGGVPGYDNSTTGDSVVTLDWGSPNWTLRHRGRLRRVSVLCRHGADRREHDVCRGIGFGPRADRVQEHQSAARAGTAYCGPTCIKMSTPDGAAPAAIAVGAMVSSLWASPSRRPTPAD